MRIDRTVEPNSGLAGWRCTVPSKINLFLEVLGKRPDGYHDLDTVMMAIDLTDTLEIYPSNSDRLTLELDLTQAQRVGDPQLAQSDRTWDIPTDGSASGGNLVLRALESLRQELAASADSNSAIGKLGARVILRKRIPSQAGLGGGSSDAAAALILGALHWGIPYQPETIAQLASRLGSDINFFLQGYNGKNWTARCTQRGQIVQPIDNHREIHGIVVHPVQGCSTAEVFARVRESIAERTYPMDPTQLLECLAKPPDSPDTSARLGQLLYNRLDAAAMQTTEWVERTAQRIHRYNPHGQCLSGSGSARFCLLSDRSQAETIAQELKREGSFRAYPFSLWASPSISDQIPAIRH